MMLSIVICKCRSHWLVTFSSNTFLIISLNEIVFFTNHIHNPDFFFFFFIYIYYFCYSQGPIQISNHQKSRQMHWTISSVDVPRFDGDRNGFVLLVSTIVLSDHSVTLRADGFSKAAHEATRPRYGEQDCRCQASGQQASSQRP